MPIYEYLCESCGRVSEVMQKVNDRPPASCPECGGRRLAKLVSRTAFQLKGGGWYADLYGSPKKEPAGRESGKEPAADAPSKPAAAEAGPSKPAAGAPGKPDKAARKKPPGKGR